MDFKKRKSWQCEVEHALGGLCLVLLFVSVAVYLSFHPDSRDRKPTSVSEAHRSSSDQWITRGSHLGHLGNRHRHVRAANQTFSKADLKPSEAQVTSVRRSSRAAYHISSNYWSACFVPTVGEASWMQYIKDALLINGALSAKKLSRQQYQAFYSEHGLDIVNMTRSTANVWLRRMLKGGAFRFALVRHPWRRLVYDYFYTFIGVCRKKLGCLRSKFDLKLPHSKKTLSFHDFIKYIAAAKKNLHPHFQPMWSLCNLDYLDYDFIADVENMSQTAFVSHKVDILRPNRTYTSFVKHTHGKLLKLEDARHLKCTQDTVKLAESLYRRDAEVLGYSFDGPRKKCASSKMKHR